MFRDLIVRYQAYQIVRKQKPYNKDKVQALGMRFAEEWNARKEAIIAFAGITEGEFDYSIHHTIMPRIVDNGAAYVQAHSQGNEPQ